MVSYAQAIESTFFCLVHDMECTSSATRRPPATFSCGRRSLKSSVRGTTLARIWSFNGPATQIHQSFVSQLDDFRRRFPGDGCNLTCDKRLSCGRACAQKCHSDVLHSAVLCLEPCPRPRKTCTHPCPKRCGVVARITAWSMSLRQTG